MPRPKLTFLDPEFIQQIVAEGIAVLSDPGVRVHNSEALSLLAEAGATVDFSAQVACIPEHLARQA